MSAFVVDRKHISYLVNTAISRRIHRSGSNFYWYHAKESKSLACNDYEKATQIGQMLWDENIKSVMSRYPDCGPDNLPGPCDETFVYEYQPNGYREINPVQVLKACDCYAYQSCEHEEWETSEAKTFIDTLRSYAWHAVDGYEEAKWEIV